MTATENIFKNRIVKKGIFDTKAIYAGAKTWMRANNYDYTENEKTTKVHKPTKGAEIIYKGAGVREITSYYEFGISFEILFERVKKVKVDGKILDQGEAEMRISADLNLDQSGEWERTKIGKILNKLYTGYVGKRKMESVYGGRCHLEGLAFFQHMKKIFKIHTF